MTDRKTLLELADRVEAATEQVPLCTDLDDDCPPLDHLHCWLYDPQKADAHFSAPTPQP